MKDLLMKQTMEAQAAQHQETESDRDAARADMVEVLKKEAQKAATNGETMLWMDLNLFVRRKGGSLYDMYQDPTSGTEKRMYDMKIYRKALRSPLFMGDVYRAFQGCQISTIRVRKRTTALFTKTATTWGVSRDPDIIAISWVDDSVGFKQTTERKFQDWLQKKSLQQYKGIWEE